MGVLDFTILAERKSVFLVNVGNGPARERRFKKSDESKSVNRALEVFIGSTPMLVRSLRNAVVRVELRSVERRD